MDLNELYKEIEKAEVDLNAKRLKYIKEALVENGGSIKLKFKEFKEFKETFYKSQREIQKVNPLYAFKVATAYFREQGKVPVFEDSNCRLIKL